MSGCLRTRVRKQPMIRFILSLRMNSSFITSRLGVALQEEWQHITKAAIRRIFSTRPDRCRACVIGLRGHIRYQLGLHILYEFKVK